MESINFNEKIRVGGIPEASNKGRDKRAAFSGSSDSKESASNAGDQGSIPGSGRAHGEANDNPFQYSCLEDSMDRGAWQAMGLQRDRYD